MEERKLNGNNMLDRIKDECESILGNSENKGERIKEVLSLGFRKGKLSFYDEKEKEYKVKKIRIFGNMKVIPKIYYQMVKEHSLHMIEECM